MALILRGRTKRLRILCTRELQNTIADSVHAVLKDIIERYGFNDYVITDKVISNRLTGTEFIFKGLRHNATEIKSTEGIDIAWVEEAQSISESSLKLLIPTIRKPGSQLIYTFNRMTELDPVYVRYVRQPRRRTYVRKVNYDVLERAGLFPDELREEMETDKAESLDLYAHVWLGEPEAQGDQAILARSSILAAMERTVSDEGAVEVGVDVARMGSDRTVFKMRKGMVEKKSAVYTKLRTTEVCDKLELFVDYQKAERDGFPNPQAVLLKVDDTGVGCLTPETKVLTPGGWRPARDLVPGDELYSKDESGAVTIERVKTNSERETEIIRMGTYEFSWAHQVPYRTRKNYGYKLGRWDEITDSAAVMFDTEFTYEAETYDFILPAHSITMPNGGFKHVTKEVEVDAYEFAILLGWYVSEGSIDRTSRCISITQVKPQHFEEIERVLSYFGKVQQKRNGNGYDFKVFNTALMEWIDENCYRGGYGFKFKTVPRWVANNSVAVIREFLRAFRDGDGYVHANGRNYYVTSSVNLPDDLKELVYKTGKAAGQYMKSKAGSTFEIEGRIATRTEDNHCVFELARTGYGITRRQTKRRKGKVHSLIISGKTRMMFTMVPGAKPIWTHNGGVTDEMIRRGYRVIAMNFGEAASDPDRYPNLISEAWFYLASIIDEISLEMDSDLLMELSSRLWKMDKKGRRGVESKDDYKKRGYRSPDKADALIMAFYNAAYQPLPPKTEADRLAPISEGLMEQDF